MEFLPIISWACPYGPGYTQYKVLAPIPHAIETAGLNKLKLVFRTSIGRSPLNIKSHANVFEFKFPKLANLLFINIFVT